MHPRTRRAWRAAAIGGLAAALLLGACSSDDGDDDASPSETDSSAVTTTTETRPEGAAAELSEELTGGNGIFIGAATPYEPDPGYVQEEYVAEGTASSYEAVGEVTPDGAWTLEPGAERRLPDTRRRPPTREQAEDFSGIVLVEWMNVSGGVDADPEFTTLREEIVRQGHAWVGVSAQMIGVEGGPVAVAVDVPGSEAAGKGLKAIDPERYGSLEHPGDAFSYDIYTQVARAVRAGAPAIGDLEPVRGRRGRRVAVGLRARDLRERRATADERVRRLLRAQPRRGRPRSSGPGSSPTSPARSAACRRPSAPTPRRRSSIQTENDVVGVLGSRPVRQPDSDLFRLWEVPGTAHADLHLVGESTAEVVDCGVPINDGPLHVVAKAAFRHLVCWVEGGEPPPEAPPIELSEGAAPVIRRDADGIALGGVRTPPVDVPVRVLSGVKGPSSGSSACSSARPSRCPKSASPSCTPRGPSSSSSTTRRRRGDRGRLRARGGPRGARGLRAPRARARVTA